MSKVKYSILIFVLTSISVYSNTVDSLETSLEKLKGKDLVLISGGCGLAPMRSLIEYCEDKAEEFGKVTILYGAKSPDPVYQ